MRLGAPVGHDTYVGISELQGKYLALYAPPISVGDTHRKLIVGAKETANSLILVKLKKPYLGGFAANLWMMGSLIGLLFS